MKTVILLIGGLTLAAFFLSGRLTDRPRVHKPEDVPIAFWAWRNQAPSQIDIQKAFPDRRPKTLFLRAGQFDIVDGSLQRIRPVKGRLPARTELHLVYNATRTALSQWEQLEPESVAKAVTKTLSDDIARAQTELVTVAGLQLDFDIPNRLLFSYAQVLDRVRRSLPPGIRLSITGLASWAATDDIKTVLGLVDFWIPQFYGFALPTSITERVPISSASDIKSAVRKARLLGKPFYAGLSAYGYAILYDKDGALLELRGDIEFAEVASNKSLELMEATAFSNGTQDSEMRYVYRSTSDLVLDGLILKQGETLVLDIPSAASLRAAARAGREEAGDHLLGICIFRLPTDGDETTLTVDQIANALADRQTSPAIDLRLLAGSGKQLSIQARNSGTASTVLGEDALTIDLDIPSGSIGRVLDTNGFAGYETLCRRIGPAQPCSERRANVLRVNARSWKPGDQATITFDITKALPDTMTAVVTTRIDDGRIDQKVLELQIAKAQE